MPAVGTGAVVRLDKLGNACNEFSSRVIRAACTVDLTCVVAA